MYSGNSVEVVWEGDERVEQNTSNGIESDICWKIIQQG